MGAEVQRLSEGAAVASEAAGGAGRAFGPWYRRQRELRGISLFYVAARTKLSPERVREIEEASASLETDGIGRATARALAHAIGADPDEAAAQLGVAQRPQLRRRPRFPLLRLAVLGVGRTAGLVLALALALWLLGLWLSSPPSNASGPARVYKPDYVDQLLRRE
ncbi:MAG: helix-turn-helix domain-containing protein [Myxococcota bacterium]